MPFQKPPHSVLIASIQSLEQRFSGRVSTNPTVRTQHANALTFIPSEPPDVVVWPEATAEVAEIVAIARHHKVPIIAFGGGTSLEGQINAPFGGICIDFSKMTKIIAVRPEDLDCTVEAGVTLGQLREELKPTGLFFPVDPGSNLATLGGMAATRASGTTTIRYGSMRDNVVSATAVLANGEIIRTARRARKSAAGYDLTRLLVGSEGTLGLITELTVRLYGVPEQVAAAVIQFPTIENACKTAIFGVQAGLNLARIELLDAMQLACVQRSGSLGLENKPSLFLEFHGSPASNRHDLDSMAAIASDHQGSKIQSAVGEDERRKLWKARHDAFWSVKAAWPGKSVLVTDVAVPLSQLAEAVTETAADIVKTKLIAPIVGHVGDGNFHTIVVFNPADDDEKQRVEGFLDRLVARAHALDGTATGEHGIGQGKARFLPSEHGSGVDAMRAIKAALDPLGVLNPGKVF